MSEPAPSEPALLMFTLWIRNDVTGESTQIKGQGKSVPDAFKEGWENANEAFGKDSSGGYISLPRLAVTLPNGQKVFRSPANFASRTRYNASEAKPAPACEGDAAKTHEMLVEEGKAEWAKPKAK